MPRDGSDEVPDLWAMAAELERQFAGYTQRLAERQSGGSAHDVDDDGASGGGDAEQEEVVVVEPGGGADSRGDVRPGRMYEAYVRRRDERLRRGWRARMERKEAEVKAFWAQLELSGRAGCGGGGERAWAGSGPTTTDDGTAAGDEEGETERDDDDDDKKRSSDAASVPRRISGKKHARARSFSSSTNTDKSSPPDVVERRRAVSQEPPPPSEPQAATGCDASREQRARRAVAAAATAAKTATSSRPKTSSLRRKSSVKGHGGSAKQTAASKKLPRSLPRRAGSGGGLVDRGREATQPSAADAAVPVPRRSHEQDVHEETPKASSPPRPSIIGGDTDAANAITASPGSDRSDVLDAVPEGEPEVKNVDVKRGDGEEVDASSPDDDKLGDPNGEITSDSDIEPSYVYIDNKDVVEEEQGVRHPETLGAASTAAPPELSAKTTKEGNKAETTTAAAPARATATAIDTTTTNAEDGAPARESSGESSFSGRLGRSSLSSAAPSCSSRDQSIERVLEADAALLRKKRAERSALKTPPDSAGSRVSSGAARSPKETTPRGFKRFLSFGKKNRAREATVIDCTSPSVSSSVADDDSGGWQSAGYVKPRMGSSSDAASDDTDRGHATPPRACSLQSLVAASPAKSELAEIVPQAKSPKAHRSFFSFRALNCGRS